MGGCHPEAGGQAQGFPFPGILALGEGLFRPVESGSLKGGSVARVTAAGRKYCPVTSSARKGQWGIVLGSVGPGGASTFPPTPLPTLVYGGLGHARCWGWGRTRAPSCQRPRTYTLRGCQGTPSLQLLLCRRLPTVCHFYLTSQLLNFSVAQQHPQIRTPFVSGPHICLGCNQFFNQVLHCQLGGQHQGRGPIHCPGIHCGLSVAEQELGGQRGPATLGMSGAAGSGPHTYPPPNAHSAVCSFSLSGPQAHITLLLAKPEVLGPKED